jgi:hypothetical protein
MRLAFAILANAFKAFGKRGERRLSGTPENEFKEEGKWWVIAWV